MKNIQIIDDADNATFSIFQATEEEFAAIFPPGSKREVDWRESALNAAQVRLYRAAR